MNGIKREEEGLEIPSPFRRIFARDEIVIEAGDDFNQVKEKSFVIKGSWYSCKCAYDKDKTKVLCAIDGCPGISR